VDSDEPVAVLKHNISEYSDFGPLYSCRRDWGSLLLIDERFAKNPQKYTTGKLTLYMQND
jgi:hypothetical protein